jgi:ATP-dependent Lon protease
MAGEEFAKVDLGYIDAHNVSTVVGVPEKAVDSIIPSDSLIPGHVYTSGTAIRSKLPSLFRMEVTSTNGEGNLITQGVQPTYSKKMAESIKAGWFQFKEKCSKLAPNLKFNEKDFMFYLNDLQNRGASTDINVALFIALISNSRERSVKNSLAVLGSISLTGSFDKDPTIIENIRSAYNAGAKNILVPAINEEFIILNKESFMDDINLIYYSSLEDAVLAALGE